MRAAFDNVPGKKARYELVRRYGYGVPSFERAAASARNDLALFAQTEIQPFKIDGTRKFNECHYYTLPIPGDMLEKLENETVELKVTLCISSIRTLDYRRMSMHSATNPMGCVLTFNAKIESH